MEHPGAGSFDEITAALGVDAVLVAKLLDALVRQGWLMVDPNKRSPVDYSVSLTPEGWRHALAWEATRHRRGARSVACRSALLDWLYEQPRTEEGHELLDDAGGYFYGLPFTVADIDEARGFLGKKGLLTGVAVAEGPGYLRPEITMDGRTCVELYDSDVAAFLTPSVKDSAVTNYHTNIHGSSGFQVAQNSPHATMHSMVTITDDHRQQLLRITRQIAEQISGLPPEQQLQAQQALAEAEAAVQDPAASKGLVRAAFDKIAVAGAVAFSSEAGKALAELGGQAIGMLPS
jgi:hypothetical protein